MKKFIVILGPDGCGKTTFVNKLSFKFKKNTLKIYTFKFILPEIKKLFSIKKKRNFKKKHAGMVVPKSFLRSTILACWYGFDYIIGHIIKRFYNKYLIISVRSYHDFFYQRAYRNINLIIPKFFLLLGPRPDLILILKRNPKNIYRDKNELTIEEIKIQYDRLKKYFGKNKNYFELEIDSKSETLSNIFDMIKDE